MPKKMDVNSKAEAARSAAEKRAEAATRKAENRRLAEAEAACVAAPPRCRVLPAAVGGCCGLRGAARPGVFVTENMEHAALSQIKLWHGIPQEEQVPQSKLTWPALLEHPSVKDDSMGSAAKNSNED
ncbi:unnamed protein product [Miscanthus lutarioriparius]|uniref:Uncharacterized protein n=1 Tax=Miscanthus lutarioriparius TaxID=422564 RepID=A0A811QKA1_9POAL|nr:unnamed protein product [Miscanthus lutarioriparius]